METQVNNKSIMLQNGLYLGLASVALAVIFYVAGLTYNTNMLVSILSGGLGLVLMIYFIVTGIKRFKNANGGFLNLGQALKTGIGIALVGAIIVSLYTYVFSTVIEPDFHEKIFQIQIEKMREENPNITEEQITAGAEMMKKFSSPLISFISSVIWSIFLGLIISLIAGAVMQKKEQTY